MNTDTQVVAQPRRVFTPITERAVSEIAWSGAASWQWYPKIATNGDLSLIAWTDDRDGQLITYAARVDSAGKVLDPLGVRIGDTSDSFGWGTVIYVSAVVWNGEAFVVIQGRNLTFVWPDLSLVLTKKVELPAGYCFAKVSSGPVVRLLYYKLFSPTGDLAVVDDNGTVIAQKPGPADPNGTYGWDTVSGATDSGFVILRNGRIADRIDFDGNVLSSNESKLQLRSSNVRSLAIAGGSEGFLLLEILPHDEVTAYVLDSAGIYQQRKIVLSEPDHSPSPYTYGGALIREGNRYIAAWQTTNDAAEDWLAEITLDGSVNVRRVGQWPGRQSGIALVSNRGRRMMATGFCPNAATTSDLFARSLSPSLEADEPQLVAFSGTIQSGLSIAAGANGYGVTWVESRFDGTVDIDVRRFSPSGTPLDPVPLTFASPRGTNIYLRTKIVAVGNTYIVGSQLPGGFAVRRLDALSGTWIDPQPVVLRDHPTDIASNGTDTLAVWVDSCSNSTGSCLVALRIPVSGPVPVQPVESIRAPFSSSTAPAIASNGSDYLVALTDKPTIPCCISIASWSLYAVRLRSDGTALHGTPLTPTRGGYPNGPKIAWSSSGTYAVVWAGSGDDGHYYVYGTRITAEGAVRDGGDGVMLTPLTLTGELQLVALDSRFVLILPSKGSDCGWDTVWNAMVFASEANLRFLPTSDQPPLATSMCGNQYGSLAATMRGGTLAVAYSRNAAEAGNVSRAYIRLFVEMTTPSRRRVAGR